MVRGNKKYCQLKKFRDYFKQNIKLQSGHYKNLSTDSLGTGSRSLGICGAHLGTTAPSADQTLGTTTPAQMVKQHYDRFLSAMGSVQFLTIL
jgi:hypothetical protein